MDLPLNYDPSLHKDEYATGGHFQQTELDTLGRIKRDGLLLVKDFDCYYCRSCGTVYGATCPNCNSTSASNHRDNYSIIVATRPLETYQSEGYRYTRVECRKCDYRFRVLIR